MEFKKMLDNVFSLLKDIEDAIRQAYEDFMTMVTTLIGEEVSPEEFEEVFSSQYPCFIDDFSLYAIEEGDDKNIHHYEAVISCQDLLPEYPNKTEIADCHIVFVEDTFNPHIQEWTLKEANCRQHENI